MGKVFDAVNTIHWFSGNITFNVNIYLQFLIIGRTQEQKKNKYEGFVAPHAYSRIQ